MNDIEIKIPDTNIKVRGNSFKGTVYESYVSKLFNIFEDSQAIMLWDSGDGVYHLMISIKEYNYPSEPNWVDSYYFLVNKKTFDVSYEYNDVYPKELKNLKLLSKIAINLIKVSNALVPNHIPDLILLEVSGKKTAGYAINTGTEVIQCTEETLKCRNIIYISF